MTNPASFSPLRLAAQRLAAQAGEARRLASGLTHAAAGAGWRSAAAGACELRLIDLGRDLLMAAALLDDAAGAVTDHAVTAARRGEELEQAARQLAGAGLAGPLVAALA